MTPRRAFLGLFGTLGMARSGWAKIPFVTKFVPDSSLPHRISCLISYGQSWESNSFLDFGSFLLNQIAVLSVKFKNQLNQVSTLSTGAGISFSSLNTIVGPGKYLSTDLFSIGRVGVIAMQLMRIRDGAVTLTPTSDLTFAYPGATWITGGGGGLAPGCSFTGSITNDLLTVPGTPTGGVISVNQMLTGAGINAATLIVSFGTGTGGAGTYNTAVCQFFVDATLVMTHATIIGHIAANVSGVTPGNILVVTTLVSGTVTVGDTVPSPALAGTVITANNGDGTYTVRAGAAQTVGSEAMQALGVSWFNQGVVISQFQAAMPQGTISGIDFFDVDYTQGAVVSGSQAEKIQNLNDMLADYDALNLPGAGTSSMRYYLQLPSAVSTAQSFEVSSYGTVVFARTNAPGAGGLYSGRVFLTAPSYPWPFANLSLPPNFTTPVFDPPRDNIHTGNYGTARWGEMLGYVMNAVKYRGVQWTPLWRSNTSPPITLSGSTVTIPFDRPAGIDFATGVLSFQSDPLDGIQVWPNFGFHVHDGAADLALTSVTISGLNVIVEITNPPTSGHSLDISYAYWGPGGVDPGNNSGVGGNLVMQGPPSVFYPGKTIDAWAFPVNETIVVP